MHFIVGDSLGGISVFYRNCSLKGRIIVTEDEGGVRGLRRAQGKAVVYFSAHSFGFFSAQKVDVPYVPCSGWHTPIHNIAIDRNSQTPRLAVSLENGDAMLFASEPGASDACDMRLKFPQVSQLPLGFHFYRDHVMALPATMSITPKAHVRELFFFDLEAMERGYGGAFSRAVTLQASFQPEQPEAVALIVPPDTRPTDTPLIPRALLTIRMAGRPGIELYELQLQPPPPLDVSFWAALSSDEMACWMRWFIRVAGITAAVLVALFWALRRLWKWRRRRLAERAKAEGKDADGKKDGEDEAHDSQTAGDGDGTSSEEDVGEALADDQGTDDEESL